MSGLERKTRDDGTPNPRYVDVLDEDAGIAVQRFTCMSFLSPDKILEKRELYLFAEFVQQWDFNKSSWNIVKRFLCESFRYVYRVESNVRYKRSFRWT